MSVASKDRITCHVLDTSVGRPARGVRVKLELSSPPTGTGSSPQSPAACNGDTGAPTVPSPTPRRVFESQTDDDGRVQSWLPWSSATSSGEVPIYTLEDVLATDVGDANASTWTLRFDTAAYFGGPHKTFFPEVAVSFRVDAGQHYHVPLLLAPYSYTTYRGS